MVESGGDWGNAIVLSFGRPRTLLFAHIDSTGFTARYENQIVRIGSPLIREGIALKAYHSNKLIKAKMEVGPERQIRFGASSRLETGTTASYDAPFLVEKNSVQSCYLDNRLGVYNALKVAERLLDGIIIFSTREEHGGGIIPHICRTLWERGPIRQALISDITWISEGVRPGKGVVVSLRDSGLPDRNFSNRIRKILDEHDHPYQLEVEESGGSDGNEIQKQPYPISWCFIGAAEENVHSPEEKVHKRDILSMTEAYHLLMQKL